MDGGQIKRAREKRGWTQEQLAQAIGVGQRTVGNWERGETIPKNRMGRLEEILDGALPETADDVIRSASDLTLLAELMRRASDRVRRTAG